MGAQLVKLYAFTQQAGGLQAAMRVAMKTGIPSSKAESAPDSPENIAKFKAAIKDATGKDAP
jgi:hypothetical protein